jgi:hypothetical protein
MEPLHILFGSSVRVKLLRLFLLNQSEYFDIGQLSKKLLSKQIDISKELKILEKAGIIVSKSLTREVEVQSKKTTSIPPKKGSRTRKPTIKVSYLTKLVTKKVPTWTLSVNCPQVNPLRQLVIESQSFSHKDIAKDISRSGSLKLLVLSGLFVKQSSDKVDMVIVGEKFDEKNLLKTIAKIESEVGKEVRYVLFTVEEFMYRMNMFDKYLLDVFAQSHETLVQKIDIPRP